MLVPRLAAILVVLVASSHSAAEIGPLLRYVFDASGTQNDVGTPPPADAVLSASATLTAATPNAFTCGALDLTAAGANHNYATSGTAVEKIKALAEMTVTFWINMHADPGYADCIISDMTAGPSPEGTGGWEIRIVGDGLPAASAFQLSFEVLRTDGNGIQSQASPSIDADNRWVFVAVTYNSDLVQRYYLGSESEGVDQIGGLAYYTFPLLPNQAEPRIGSASSEPTVDRTPPAWIDDVRIYDRALCVAELEDVRLENLGYAHLHALPGFVALGGVPGQACGVEALSISGDGSTVVGRAFGPEGQFAYRWDNGTRSLLPGLPGGMQDGAALRCSPDGSVTVGWGRPAEGGREAVRWDADGNAAGLGDFPGGERFSAAYGTSRNGLIIAGLGVDRSGYLTDAFRYEQGILAKLGYLPGGNQSTAFDISRDGNIIVGSSESTAGTQAFRWSRSAFTPLGDLTDGAFESQVNRIAANNAALAGWGTSTAGREAALWINYRVFGLGRLPGGSYSEAQALSGQGSFVVGQADTLDSNNEVVQEAFLWSRADGMRTLRGVLEEDYELDLTGWHLAAATGISDDGSTITGYGINPAGLTDSFLVRLPVPDAVMDFDRDGDVDDDDLILFRACATGPGMPYDPQNLPPGCPLTPDSLELIAADLDGDGDVDHADFGILQRCAGFPGDFPPAHCRG